MSELQAGDVVIIIFLIKFNSKICNFKNLYIENFPSYIHILYLIILDIQYKKKSWIFYNPYVFLHKFFNKNIFNTQLFFKKIILI